MIVAFFPYFSFLLVLLLNLNLTLMLILLIAPGKKNRKIFNNNFQFMQDGFALDGHYNCLLSCMCSGVRSSLPIPL